MFDLKPLIGVVSMLAFSSPAFAYGIAISSTTGANIDTQFKQYEVSILDKLAACTKDATVPPTSSCDVIIDQNGKVVDAYFRPLVPPEPAASATLQKIKGIEFGAIPGVQEGDVTITFNFTELQTPPYRMNSLRISSKGSINAGNIDASGKPKVAIRPPGGRVYGNRISGPIELGPPREATGTARAGQLSVQVQQALANKKYDEAISLQKQVIELTKTNRPNDKRSLLSASFRLVKIAIEYGQATAVKDAFAQAIAAVDEAGEAGAQSIARLASFTHQLINKGLIDTADSGVRKAVELDAVLLKSGETSGRTSLAYPLKAVTEAHQRKGDYDAALALQRYRLEQYKAAEPDNTAAIVICQLDLSSALLAAAAHKPGAKAKLMDESNQLFEDAKESTRKSFGADSQEYKNAIQRRIVDLTRAGDSEGVQKLQKLLSN